MSKTEVTTTSSASKGEIVPDFLKDKGGAILPGVETSDLILPRIKLLQAISPEVEQFDTAKNGLFWHSLMGEPIGDSFEFIVVAFKKKFLLMAPLGDPRGTLARAEDGVNWSPPNETFEVKLKGVKEPQKWTTKPTVKESGLDQFGSSIAGDRDSKPAAVLMYEFLVFLPELRTAQPIVMTLARSGARKGKDLISKILARDMVLQGMKFKAGVVDESGDEGPYKNWQFTSAGFADEAQYTKCVELADRFKTTTYKVAGEEEEAAEPAASGKPSEY